ncbi:MAG: 3-deoxy-manno-octulosonate cytidylyltransferase [Steroidobacteraceae bacterium]|jgi:3-deoxy-manno-octulosonate cytidylyltransferase (CMP-KDO synthetase)|nr:3-deoxy-manno-octulosonate cytidylyltransferase [Steroidobacteraceae bacterium]
MTAFRVVVPARWGSTRLPGKPLRLLAGRPMIEHVWRRACESGAAEVLVATDDERIASACREFGATAVLTDPGHPSGTDRLAEVARTRGWPAHEIVVNVQGDEPLLPPANVAQVAQLLDGAPDCAIATLATPVRTLHEFLDPNAVKVALGGNGRALYFSRAPIPWARDGAPAGLASQTAYAHALRHLGLYAYRCGSLLRLAALPPSPLEDTEKLEQLRALESGMRIAVAVAVAVPGPGVDTEADLAAADALLRAAPP